MPRGGYATDWNNVAPRVGVTWAAGRDGRTVVRTGYGVYFSQSALAPSEALYFSPPYFRASFYFPVPSAACPCSLSDPFPATFPVPSPPSALAIQRDLETPSLQHWNVAVERQLGRAWSAQLAYTGSRGQHLIAARDANQATPSAAPLNLRPNPFFSDITLLESRARSRYHAFIISGERRLDRGFSLVGVLHLVDVQRRCLGVLCQRRRSQFSPGQQQPAGGVGAFEFRCAASLSAAFVYDLPLGARARACARLAGEWDRHASVRPAVYGGALTRHR